MVKPFCRFGPAGRWLDWRRVQRRGKKTYFPIGNYNTIPEKKQQLIKNSLSLNAARRAAHFPRPQAATGPGNRTGRGKKMITQKKRTGRGDRDRNRKKQDHRRTGLPGGFDPAGDRRPGPEKTGSPRTGPRWAAAGDRGPVAGPSGFGANEKFKTIEHAAYFEILPAPLAPDIPTGFSFSPSGRRSEGEKEKRHARPKHPPQPLKIFVFQSAGRGTWPAGEKQKF